MIPVVQHFWKDLSELQYKERKWEWSYASKFLICWREFEKTGTGYQAKEINNIAHEERCKR